MVFFNIKKSETFFLYKICMRVAGVWPLDRHRCGSNIVLWVITSLQVATVTMHLLDHFGKRRSNKFGSPDFYNTTWQILTLVTNLSLRAFASRMVPVIRATIDDWSMITKPSERNIMIRHNKRGFYNFVLFAALIMFSNVKRFNVMLTIITKSRNVATCAFDVNSTLITIKAVLNFVMQCIYGLITWSSYALFWSLAMHLSAQYKILKTRFHDLLRIEEKEESLKEFRQLVERHNRLFALNRDYADSFSVYIMLSIIARQIHACIGAVDLTANIKARNFNGGAHSLFSITVALLGLFGMYYAGDYLTDCCQEVGEEFTQCNWYDLSKKYRTHYSIVISRCRMPMELTAVKIYEMNLSNFKFVLEALYSYISFMLAYTV